MCRRCCFSTPKRTGPWSENWELKSSAGRFTLQQHRWRPGSKFAFAPAIQWAPPDSVCFFRSLKPSKLSRWSVVVIRVCLDVWPHWPMAGAGANDDGIHFQFVCYIPPGAILQQTMLIPVTTARYFRIVVKKTGRIQRTCRHGRSTGQNRLRLRNGNCRVGPCIRWTASTVLKRK